METLAFCAGNSQVTGDFPAQKPVIFDDFFDLSLNQRLSKQRRRWSFETPSRSLWRHCNVRNYLSCYYLPGYIYSKHVRSS